MGDGGKASLYAIFDLLSHFPPIHPLRHKLGGEINFSLKERWNKINSCIFILGMSPSPTLINGGSLLNQSWKRYSKSF